MTDVKRQEKNLKTVVELYKKIISAIKETKIIVAVKNITLLPFKIS